MIPSKKSILAVTLGTVFAVAQLSSAAMAQEQGNTLQRADDDMKRVLQKLEELGAKPLGTQSVEATRKQPTPADAVNAVLEEQGKDPKQVMDSLNVSTKSMTYPAGEGTQPVRIFTPGGEAPEQGWPVIVYYHGGGWVIANIDTYAASAMGLANEAEAIVASVEYRHAPEHTFPAAHEDAFAAYKWALENAKSFGGDPQRVAVAGESAGGNLAINTAIMARENNVQMPEHMLLVYPVAGTDMNTESYKENANAMPLSRDAMQWFVKHTISEQPDLQDPRLDVVGRANLQNLPDATVITAEIDPLRSEGKMLAEKLEQAGSDVQYKNYEGVTHEFFGMFPVVDDARQALEFAANELEEDLESAEKD